jgi:D-alanine-D-alanine ligase
LYTQQRSIVPSPKNSAIHPLADFSSHSLDVVFPVLHGPYGEDGTIQGMCKMLTIPFVGPDVLGSAVGMDKDVTKRLLRDGGIPTARFGVVRRNDDVSFGTIAHDLGVPFFLKPANLGSSIGVAKVTSEEGFKEALHSAFAFDNKVLIEESIQGREIECAVLGNEKPVASVAGEIVPKGHDFYDYEAKYLDENGAELIIPADLPKTTLKQIQSLAIKTFQTLCCEGMARVDFFLTKNNEIFVNEINTIPGFTNISMYPKLWEASGVSYPELIDRLITLAIERHTRDAVHKSTRS